MVRAADDLLRASLLSLSGSPFPFPFSGKNIRQRVVSLVARVLIDDVVGHPRHWTFDGPGLCVDLRILDGELVVDVVFIDTREALDGTRIWRGREAVLCLGAVVKSFNNKGIAIPMSA